MASTKQAEPSERDLVAAIAKGSAEALRGLSLRYGRMLSGLAMRFLENESDAEEAVSDVLWQVWREARSFDPSRGSVSVWLVTLARSRSIDRLRAIRARSELPDAQPPELVPDPASQIDQAERARIVRAALAVPSNT